jgi:hypothetical protein
MTINSSKAGLRVSSVIFGLVCLAQVARLFAGTPVTVGGHHLGVTASWLCLGATGGLAIWLARLAGPWCEEMREAPRTEP